MSSRGHSRSASGMTVWLVYATVLDVISHALSQSRPSTSTRMRMSSGAARVGCVSFIWIATFSGSVSQSERFHAPSTAPGCPCTEAEQSMYCCDRRRHLPSLVPSPG